MTKFNRRQFGALAGAAALSPALSNQVLGQSEDRTIRIGFVGPRSGPLAPFGEADAFVADAFRAAQADGLRIGDTTYAVEVIEADTQSDPIRASQEVRDMINGQSPDIVLAASTPETTNPVLDACESAGVPGLTTIAPWEAVYFGRGARPGEPSPFKWTFHFSFGAGDFSTLYADQWSKVETNRKVGMLLPNDADGNAIRGGLIPALEGHGYEIFDAGPYENGGGDFSNQIRYFRENGVEIVNSFPFPPDFAVFWRQAAQLGLAQQVRIMQIAKAGLFPAEMEALGQLGYGVATGAYWHRAFPTRSPALNMTSEELATGFQQALGKQWTQQPGAVSALFDVAVAAFQASGNPKDKSAVAAAIGGLTTETAVGTIDFAGGPVPGIATAPLLGAQWVQGQGDDAVDLMITSNALAPEVPITAPLQPFRLGS